MPSTALNPPGPGRAEVALTVLFFLASLAFHHWGSAVGWQSKNLPGGEFRQAQTALSTYFIQRDDDYSLAYPTPVLGKPWSIPMEFPLYQWTVARLSSATGWDLTKTGRTVSLACFYLTLPAIFLLLGRLGLTGLQRLVVLGLVLTCPLYIYYGRAFLIETMALLFSAWFLLAFLRAVENRSAGWLVLANLFGVGAGLVKVTTFMLFLMPAGLVALSWLWSARPVPGAARWRPGAELAGWIAAATAIPFGVTLGWIRFADSVKRLNPSARFLQSDNLTDFNFGTMANRFSAETGLQHWQTISQAVVWPPVLLLGAILFWALPTRRRWPVFFCLGCYLAVLALFPTLYALHEYYAVANAVFLLVALGLVFTGLSETRCPRWLVAVVLLGVWSAQTQLYVRGYFPQQRGISAGGSGLTEALRHITAPNEVLVVAGDDWSSITPFFAERRALMLRRGVQDQATALEESLATLADEQVGAVVLQGALRENNQLRDRLIATFGLRRSPAFTWREAEVFLPEEHWLRASRQIQQRPFDGVRLAGDGGLPPIGGPGGEWRLLSELAPEARQKFSAMTPQPVGYYASFGPGLEWRENEPWFNAHPTTRLRFLLPAGPHVLRTTVVFSEGAYRGSFGAHEPPTDGVVIRLLAGEGSARPRVLFDRLLDPFASSEDQGEQHIEVPFFLPEPTAVDLYFGPGPQGRDTRDWIWLRGPVVFN
ncbi:MAG: glycosyltransferase family 39 protein [Candidatus Didemnitutus sp.]|nr:glycosyltransferase family 39 protein [Candidatus Didemnitutus sp.]